MRTSPPGTTPGTDRPPGQNSRRLAFERVLGRDAEGGAAWRAQLNPRRSRLVRVLAWSGLLIPAGIIQTRDPGAVVDDPFTPVTLLRGLLPGLCLLAVLVVSRPAPRPVGSRECLLAGYLAVVVASTGWSLAPQATLLKAGHLVTAYGLLVVVTRLWPDRRQALHELTALVYAVVGLSALFGVVARERAIDTTEYLYPLAGRLKSVFPEMQPVVLGMFAATAILLAVAGGGRGFLQHRAFRFGIGAVSVAVLLLTGSRAAVVMAVLGPVMCGVLRAQARVRPRTALLTIVLGTAAVLSPLGVVLRARLTTEQAPTMLVTFNGRLPMWQDALQTAADRPLHGFGYYAGHRLGEYAELFKVRVDATRPPYVDGTWAETLLDLGLLGCLTLLVFVVQCWRVLWVGRDRSSSDDCLLLALLTLLTLYSLQDYTLQQVGYPMVLFAGALLSPKAAQDAGDALPFAQRAPTSSRSNAST